MEERIQKIMAYCGVAARRKCEQLIEQGRVTVNGIKAKIGDTTEFRYSVIMVDGKMIQKPSLRYIIFNKPKNVVTTVTDPMHRSTIMDFVDVQERVFPVGRLDYDAEGLLLLTNDGELANRIMHPRYEIKKTYFVVLDRQLVKEDAVKLMKGVYLEDGKTWPAQVKIMEAKRAMITIHEGRKWIVKRMFAKLNYKVRELRRERLGNLILGNLAPGKSRDLARNELLELKRILKMD